MRDGRWLSPRYPSREIFERDYPKVDMSGLEVYCPGCRAVVRLTRAHVNGRVGGWCPACSRAVTV
ncbi:MAG: hypothetical protein KGL53_16210 [Elusimicrobia bacterium]|nr:hypothetical protein [Elusimicrobiota bacterium]